MRDEQGAFRAERGASEDTVYPAGEKGFAVYRLWAGEKHQSQHDLHAHEAAFARTASARTSAHVYQPL